MTGLKPAILILSKRGERTRYLFFEDHNGAFDTAEAFTSKGWRYEMHLPEVYRADDPPPAPSEFQQMELFE